MTAEESAPGPRRRGRPPGSSNRATSTTRRRRIGGTELVDTLNEMVGQLIKENRRLKSQLAKLTGGLSAVDGTAEKTLRSLHRKVQRAVSSAPIARRRRSTSTQTTPRRRASRQRTAPGPPS
jgi:hypothetical protein